MQSAALVVANLTGQCPLRAFVDQQYDSGISPFSIRPSVMGRFASRYGPEVLLSGLRQRPLFTDRYRVHE